MAGRKLSRTREECAASHSPGLTETVFGIKNLTVKMLQESYEHFICVFLVYFQLLTGEVEFKVFCVWEVYYKNKVCKYIPQSCGIHYVLVVLYVVDYA